MDDTRPAPPRLRGNRPISPFLVMELLAAASATDAALAADPSMAIDGVSEVAHLEVGQPSTPAPRLAREAAAHAVLTETLGYTPALGIDPLRQAIAADYRQRFDIDVAASQVVVTLGASGAFLTAAMAVVEAGDVVLLAEPTYPCYRNIVEALGADARCLSAGAGERAVDPLLRALRSGFDVAAVVIATPSNPTGALVPQADIVELAHACAAAGATLIVDEIYHRLVYDQPPESAASLVVGPQRSAAEVIVINSFSKYHSMTGWRVGWMVVRPDRIESIERLNQNLFICAPAVSQVAALAALGADEELEMHRARYRRNRDYLVEALDELGLELASDPQGAFYLWLDTSSFGIDSTTLCKRWLNEAHVAATPGADFDRSAGGSHVRLSYAGDIDTMRLAVDRLRRWMADEGVPDRSHRPSEAAEQPGARH